MTREQYVERVRRALETSLANEMPLADYIQALEEIASDIDGMLDAAHKEQLAVIRAELGLVQKANPLKRERVAGSNLTQEPVTIDQIRAKLRAIIDEGDEQSSALADELDATLFRSEDVSVVIGGTVVDPNKTGPVFCRECGHRWQGVWPAFTPVELLECP